MIMKRRHQESKLWRVQQNPKALLHGTRGQTAPMIER
jgi:hypothetical protein